jgi:hypothetical protein
VRATNHAKNVLPDYTERKDEEKQQKVEPQISQMAVDLKTPVLRIGAILGLPVFSLREIFDRPSSSAKICAISGSVVFLTAVPTSSPLCPLGVLCALGGKNTFLPNGLTTAIVYPNMTTRVVTPQEPLA